MGWCSWLWYKVVMEEVNDVVVTKGDKLILRGLMFHGFHGVKPEENKLGQKFVIDVDAWMDLQPAGLSDSVSDTVSYTDIYRWDIVSTLYLWILVVTNLHFTEDKDVTFDIYWILFIICLSV